MSASLYFNYVYAADASQTTTLKVTGEQQDAPPAGVSVDETVVVNVTASQLNTLMTVGAQSEAGVGYPTVTLDWESAVGNALNTKWAAFMGVTGPGVAPVNFADDSSPAVAKPTLQKVFSTETFAYTANPTSPLLKIPPEAISNVDYSGAISIKKVGADLSKTVMAGGGTILGASITAESGDLSANDKKAVRGLFLQALAAGRYQQSSTAPPNGSDLPSGASPGFAFETGDIVSFYTVLSLTKTRTFIPDTDNTTVEGNSGMKFKVNGVNVIIGGGTSTADDSVASDAKTWTVRWQLTVA
uniref:Uncharacterized protein n=1 Tax=viral metagenome TaxID=1070528 RepID=A0A6C0HGR3_9ZZZZ